MTQTIVTLSEHQNRIVSIIKGKFGLKNKSQAINLIIEQFEEKFLEPELRPEYKKELQKIDSGKFKKFSSIDALRREIENVHA